eukprot:Polyplicarium_translucidae@DN2390_c1_g1_i2.p1
MRNADAPQKATTGPSAAAASRRLHASAHCAISRRGPRAATAALDRRSDAATTCGRSADLRCAIADAQAPCSIHLRPMPNRTKASSDAPAPAVPHKAREAAPRRGGRDTIDTAAATPAAGKLKAGPQRMTCAASTPHPAARTSAAVSSIVCLPTKHAACIIQGSELYHTPGRKPCQKTRPCF